MDFFHPFQDKSIAFELLVIAGLFSLNRGSRWGASEKEHANDRNRPNEQLNAGNRPQKLTTPDDSLIV